MTLQEYKTQKDPRHGVTVQVKPSELEYSILAYGGRLVGLHVCGQRFEYFIPEGNRRFWTMDNHGNKKSPSVFTLILLT